MRKSWLFMLRAGGIVAAMGFALAHTGAQTDNKPPAKQEGKGTAAAKKDTPKPGKDRWLVKTASDPDAVAISKEPVKTTVENLLAIARPEDMPLTESNTWFQEHRARPAETTLWTVEADVIGCQLMADGDYRVTIRGASGKTMVLEMPDPDPAFVDPKSPFAPKLKSARSQFERKQHPERSMKELKGHAIITGIGFFGRAYGKQAGEVKGNLIQLHPVVNFSWLETPTREFTAPAEKTPPTSRPPMPE